MRPLLIYRLSAIKYLSHEMTLLHPYRLCLSVKACARCLCRIKSVALYQVPVTPVSPTQWLQVWFFGQFPYTVTASTFSVEAAVAEWPVCFQSSRLPVWLSSSRRLPLLNLLYHLNTIILDGAVLPKVAVKFFKEVSCYNPFIKSQ